MLKGGERADRVILSALAKWDHDVIYGCIASNANEPEGFLRSVATGRGIPNAFLDPDQTVAGLYGALTTPHLFVLDTQGVVRYQGALDDVTFR